MNNKTELIKTLLPYLGEFVLEEIINKNKEKFLNLK